MAKAENKTTATKGSVDSFLKSVTDKQALADSYELIELMQSVTKQPPVMWGPSIIGFGSYHYKYESGREGDMLAVGFAPRKGTMSIYIMGGFAKYDELMTKLGKHKTGKSCLYVKKLDDIDRKVLKTLIKESYNYVIKKKWDKPGG